MHIHETSCLRPNARTFVLEDKHSHCQITVSYLEDTSLPGDMEPQLTPEGRKKDNRDVSTDLARLSCALLPQLGNTLRSTS